jgi:hypothetical protein
MKGKEFTDFKTAVYNIIREDVSNFGATWGADELGVDEIIKWDIGVFNAYPHDYDITIRVKPERPYNLELQNTLRERHTEILGKKVKFDVAHGEAKHIS